MTGIDAEDEDLESAYIRSNGVTEWRWSVYRRLKNWWSAQGNDSE